MWDYAYISITLLGKELLSPRLFLPEPVIINHQNNLLGHMTAPLLHHMTRKSPQIDLSTVGRRPHLKGPEANGLTPAE